MTIKARQVPNISAGEVRHWSVSFVDTLDTGEVLSSSTTAELVTSDLTITSAVNSSSHVIDGTTASSGQAVIGTVLGQAANTSYVMRVTAVTAASQTLVIDLPFWSD